MLEVKIYNCYCIHYVGRNIHYGLALCVTFLFIQLLFAHNQKNKPFFVFFALNILIKFYTNEYHCLYNCALYSYYDRIPLKSLKLGNYALYSNHVQLDNSYNFLRISVYLLNAC